MDEKHQFECGVCGRVEIWANVWKQGWAYPIYESNDGKFLGWLCNECTDKAHPENPNDPESYWYLNRAELDD